MLEVDYLGCDVEIGVVVDEGELMLAGQYRGEQVGNPDGPVPAGSGQSELGVERLLPVPGLDAQVLVGGAP